MPKQENTRINSFKSRTRASPYPSNGSSSHHRVPSSSSSASPLKPTQEETKEWEEARCSVCMEHPHNAVLLSCTSIKNGCRPFMCDTSYRHSNCLDQYKKAFTKISCPLCRGSVDGWTVDKSARWFMDSKVRSCSKESCGFSGTYVELRKHARKEHPLDRPSTADPERQQDWQRMVQRRDFEDLMSTMRGELNSEEDGGGLERLFNEDENEVGLVGRLRISPIAVLLLIRYTFRMDENLESVSSPRRSPQSSSVVASHAGEESNDESSDAEYVNEENETVVRERRRRTREILRRRMSMRFPDYESDDASEEAVRVRRRLMRLSPVAESDDDDDGNDRVQDRPRRRRMRLLPDDDGDDDEDEEEDDSVDRVEERPRRRRMRLPDDESDDYL